VAISADGHHYSVSLLNGGLVIRSKQLEQFEEDLDDEAKMIMKAFTPSFKSTSKNYKYFYRGQYDVVPESQDIIKGMKSKK
jgi:hypothetical protein